MISNVRAGTVLLAFAGGLLSFSCSHDGGSTAPSSAGGPVSPNATPVAAFAVAQSLIVAGSPVTFDATGTSSGGARCGNACSFIWTFGDSTTGSGESVSHIYSAPGSYPVTLTVTQAGVSASVSHAVAVEAAAAKPTADFSYSPTTPTVGQDIIFNAEKAAAASGRRILSWNWAFGNGRTGSGLTTVMRYDTPGSYVITLTVTDDAGETGVADKTAAVLALPSPTAVLTFSPATPSTSTTVFFDATASTVPSPATIESYTFNYGDGTADGPSALPRQTHSFAGTGIYVVRLTVTDSLGRTGTTTVNVPVTAVSPVAVLTFSPQDPKTATTVFFDGSGSTTPSPAVITSYTFNYGDGTGDGPAASARQTHAFAAAATYVVRLTVTDSAGRSATTTVSVTVKAP